VTDARQDSAARIAQLGRFAYGLRTAIAGDAAHDGGPPEDLVRQAVALLQDAESRISAERRRMDALGDHGTAEPAYVVGVAVGGSTVECRSANRTATGYRLSLRFAHASEWVEADASPDGWVGSAACFDPSAIAALCSPETARSQPPVSGGVHPQKD
jgi:hypothetical protein